LNAGTRFTGPEEEKSCKMRAGEARVNPGHPDSLRARMEAAKE